MISMRDWTELDSLLRQLNLSHISLNSIEIYVAF